MPGTEVCDLVARLQALHPEMRVLYISGHGAATLSTHGINEGRADFLHKPFGQPQLARRVRRILDQRADAHEAPHTPQRTSVGRPSAGLPKAFEI